MAISKYFEVKVRYDKIDPQSGKDVTVTEPYLIDAVSFTDTEKSIHKELEPYITGEFEVRGEKISEFVELIPDENGDRWYKCRIVFISINEESGATKETGIWVLVQASTIKEAYDNINKKFEDTVSEYRIKGVVESAIVEVFANLAQDDLPTDKEKEVRGGVIDQVGEKIVIEKEEFPFPEDEIRSNSY